MKIDLKLALKRRLQGSTKRINAGDVFTFQLTNIKNPHSTQPTSNSVVYSIYTQGELIEQKSTELIIENTEPGLLDALRSSVVPSEFKQNLATNYTITFQPINYQQNMRIVVRLPA